MLYGLYTLCFGLLILVTLPWWLWLYHTTPKYRGTVRPRLARFTPAELAALPRGRCFWVHAVSVGETVAAQGLVERLHQRHPELAVVITTVTRTGQQVARERLPWVEHILYLPVDLPWITRRFVRLLQPRFVVVMETELWPNLFRALEEAGVPLATANGRLSPTSHRHYRWFAGAMRRFLRPVRLFAMQSASDAERMASLGVEAARLRVTGNLKYDQALRPPEAAAWAQLTARLPRPAAPIWLAASTHPGEEESILAAHRQLRERFAGLRLILVPRHPERAGQVAALIAGQGLDGARFSRTDGAWEAEVLLVDQVGWLGRLYGYADAVFVGGSLVPHGGQNVLEPASWEIPPVCGPHTFNFKEAMRQLREAGATVEIADAAALPEAIGALLGDPDRRRALGARAKAVVLANTGALERTLAALAEVIPP